MKNRKKTSKVSKSSKINSDEKVKRKKIEIRCLKTNYPVGDDGIKQLVIKTKRLVNCNISSDDDYYIFTYDAENFQTFDSVRNARLIDKYGFILAAGELEELTPIYSFSLNPNNVLIDAAFRPNVIDRTFSIKDNNFLDEYKALIGTTLDIEHSYEDFLRGGADLFLQSDILYKVFMAKSASEVREIILEAIENEREYENENFVVIKKNDIIRNKRLLPIVCIIMVISIFLFGYEHFIKGKINDRIMTATEQYFANDYGSVGKSLKSLNETDMSNSTRYMAAVSAVKSSGLTSTQKENVLKAIDQYRTNKDYLNYWVMIGRHDYITADDYAQKFGDNEHRIFALAQRKAQVSKDASMTGSKKTETLNALDEKIKKLLKLVNEERYGLTNDSNSIKEDNDIERKSNEKSASNEDAHPQNNSDDEPKLLK